MNMPFILQRTLVASTILLVVMHGIETCCGREPLDGFGRGDHPLAAVFAGSGHISPRRFSLPGAEIRRHRSIVHSDAFLPRSDASAADEAIHLFDTR